MRILIHRKAVWVGVFLGGSLCGAAALAVESTTDSTSKPASDSGQVNPQRKKLVETIMRQIGKIKPSGGNPKKELEDYFLVGLAEVTPATGHANVQFEVRQGQQETAEHLADYTLTAPEKVARKWHVFGRMKESQQADEALQNLRMQYDRAVAYQAELKRIYAATSIRRT